MKNLTKKTGFIPVVLSLVLVAAMYPQVQNDKQAEDILKAVSAKYKTYTSVKASFSIARENAKDKTTQTQNGTIYLKGNKYKIELQGQEIYSDGKTVWSYLKDAGEVQIQEAKQDEDAITPSSIFTIYEKGYNYKFIEEKAEGGKTIQYIELIPVDKNKKIFKIRLAVDKAEKQVISSKMFEKSGDRTTYTIVKFTPNQELADSFFTFDPKAHPGVEIIDMR